MHFPFLRISLFVTFALLLSSLAAQSKFSLFQPLHDAELGHKIQPTISQFDLLTVDEVLLQRIARDKPASFTLQIPFEGATLSVDLEYHDVLGDDFKLFAGNEKSKQPVIYDGGAYYRGKLVGVNNALVAISFFEDEIIGVIADGGGNINLGLLLDSGPNNGLTAIVYRERFHTQLPEFECNANTDDTTADNKPKPSVTKSSMQINSCFDTYLEGDYQLYQERQSNVSNATNFITGMWNVVAALYDAEQLTANISEIFIWTSNDPYANNNNGAALNDFRERMGNTGFNGDLAHLVSRGNSLGGVAYVDVVCSNFTEIKTGVSTVASSYNQLPNYSWSINVLTHEIGHNLGSPHTHDCAWNGNNSPIDGCGYQFNNDDGCPGPIPNQGGTIMSYCHLIGGVGVDFSLGFGTQPGNLIRGIVAGCSDCSDPDPVIGCTNPNAHNYDPTATQNDGSCQTCFDGIRNGDETSIDCGGSLCEPCFECANNIGSIYLNNEQIETDICAGENANLVFNFGNADNPPYSLAYNDGVSDFFVNDIFPNNSGNYFFNVTPSVTTGYSIISMVDAEGCEFENFENQAAFLNVLEVPNPDAPQDIETCEANATFPAITGINGGVNSFYRRVGANQSFQPGQTTTVSGDYLQIVDNNGCISELPFTITIGGPDCNACSNNVGSLTLQLGEVEGDICSGESTTLIFNFGNQGTPPFTLVYNDDNQDITVNNINPASNGNYTVTVSPEETAAYNLISMTDSEGCEFENFTNQTVFVNVISQPTPDAPQDIQTCENSVVFPAITGTGGGATSYYRLLGSNQNFQPGQTTTISGTYLQIVEINDCRSELSFTISIGGLDCEVAGCTDPEAHNYDPAATQNDGSCETCFDGIQNGDETAIDCGGSKCEPCFSCPDNVGNLTLQFGEVESDICLGESTTLTFNFGNQGTPPFTLVYNDDNQDITVNNINPASNGNYTVTVSPEETTAYNLISMTDGESCEFENFINQTVFVNVIPQPTPDAPQDIQTCENSVVFPAITGIGGGTTSYYRLIGTNQNFQPGMSTSASGTYLQIVDINDCRSELSFTVTIGGPDCETFGCTDPGAHNYNTNATEDNGRCETCEDEILNGDETGIDCGGQLCEPCAGDTLRLTGNIHLESGQQLANVPVQVLMGGDTTLYQTDSIGDFKVANVILDSNYLLRPISPVNDTTTSNAVSGINIFDVIALQRYLLGLSEPDALSPYQLIAADADESQSISVSDIITSIQVLLGVRDSFPGGRNWIFVDADYVFPDPLDPWSATFPEYRIVDSLERDSLNNDFIAIKLGNVTGGVQQGLVIEPRSSIQVSFENAPFRNGNPVQLKGSFDYTAAGDELCYFEVSYDQNALIYRKNLLINEQKPLVVDDREPGLLKVFWNSRNHNVQNPELVIDFIAKRNGELSSAVHTRTAGYWVDQAGTPSRINFAFINEASSATTILNESIVFPNPTRGQIQVGLTKGFTNDHMLATLYDLNGKQVGLQSVTPPQGSTQFPINLDEMGKLNSGVYFLKLSSDLEVKTFRIVIE